MPKHYHVTVVCWDGIKENGVQYINGTTVTLIGFSDEKEACERAAKLIKRKEYQVQSMYQCNTCRFQEEVSGSFKKMSGNEYE